MKKLRLLDLFCGAGGAAMGYHLAGFEVIGVDIMPQPHYPFRFIQADALTFPLGDFDVIHASPPCQAYTRARHIPHQHTRKHPQLIEQIRSHLKASGLPYIIENVPHSPLINPLLLCGTLFDLPLYRHRLFETSLSLHAPTCWHPHKLLPGYLCIYGNVVRGSALGNRGNRYPTYSVQTGRNAMGITWYVTQLELSQSIPPAYTLFLGTQIRSLLCHS